MNYTEKAAIMMQAIEIMREHRGGLATTIAVMQETADDLAFTALSELPATEEPA